MSARLRPSTFVTASGRSRMDAIYVDKSIWLTQKMLAQQYDVNARTVNGHLKKIFDAVIRKFRITATDGKNYNTQHYKLHASKVFATPHCSYT